MSQPCVVVLNVEHPGADGGVSATVVCQPNDFGPQLIAHMAQSLYDAIMQQVRENPAPSLIVMPKKPRLVK